MASPFTIVWREMAVAFQLLWATEWFMTELLHGSSVYKRDPSGAIPAEAPIWSLLSPPLTLETSLYFSVSLKASLKTTGVCVHAHMRMCVCEREREIVYPHYCTRGVGLTQVTAVTASEMGLEKVSWKR